MTFYKQFGGTGGYKVSNVKTGCVCGDKSGNCTSKNMQLPRIALSDLAPEDKQIFKVLEDIVQERAVTSERKDEKGNLVPATITRTILAKKGDYVNRAKALELGLIQPE